ncbi:hypothetical protein [Aliamphritea spongicola]|uniref:hypothetical protein n=1 Tax=Aliamphritea spongicola TaxID=707589 RepID=UPI00196AF500|nr:hypothetical protein [Aliamphritea spongicola]MBN3561624.1 hypothetical protein [Aliamphritea spongicola]
MITLLSLAVLACLFVIGYSLRDHLKGHNSQPQALRIPVEEHRRHPQRRRRR